MTWYTAADCVPGSFTHQEKYVLRIGIIIHHIKYMHTYMHTYSLVDGYIYPSTLDLPRMVQCNTMIEVYEVVYYNGSYQVVLVKSAPKPKTAGHSFFTSVTRYYSQNERAGVTRYRAECSLWLLPVQGFRKVSFVLVLTREVKHQLYWCDLALINYRMPNTNKKQTYTTSDVVNSSIYISFPTMNGGRGSW